MKTHRVVITPGEPAGIGPDLVVQLAQRSWPVELVVCADASVLKARAQQLNLPLTLLPYQAENAPSPASGYLNAVTHSASCPGYPGTTKH